MIKFPFFKKLSWPEFKQISGKNFISLIILSIILSISLLSIGLANGSISYLSKKMESPFVSFIKVVIPMSHSMAEQSSSKILNEFIKVEDDLRSLELASDKLVYKNKKLLNSIEQDTLKPKIERDSIIKILNQIKDNILSNFEIDKEKKINGKMDEFKLKYGLNRVPVIGQEDYCLFRGNSNKESKSLRIRLGINNDPLINFLENEGQFLTKNEFDHRDLGCIISFECLKNKLGYDTITMEQIENKSITIPFITYRRNVNEIYQDINIPVSGILRELPDELDLIVGKLFFNPLDDLDFYDYLITDKHRENDYLKIFILNSNKILIDDLKNEGFKEFDGNEVKTYIKEDGVVLVKENINSFEKESIRNDLLNFEKDNKQAYIRNKNSVYDLPGYENITQKTNKENEQKNENLIFQFKKNEFLKVDSLRLFLADFEEQEGNSRLDVDMSIIESKKNFDQFNKLANLLSLSLIFFSIFSIVIYVTSLVISHISRNKKSLGTLKAFGLSNNNIILIYSTISISLILISFVFSYFSSLFLGSFMMTNVANYFKITDISNMVFQSYDFITLLFIFVIVPSVVIYYTLWSNLKGSTPGDLIYERD